MFSDNRCIETNHMEVRFYPFSMVSRNIPEPLVHDLFDDGTHLKDQGSPHVKYPSKYQVINDFPFKSMIRIKGNGCYTLDEVSGMLDEIAAKSANDAMKIYDHNDLCASRSWFMFLASHRNPYYRQKYGFESYPDYISKNINENYIHFRDGEYSLIDIYYFLSYRNIYIYDDTKSYDFEFDRNDTPLFNDDTFLTLSYDIPDQGYEFLRMWGVPFVERHDPSIQPITRRIR